ncbi:MAG TPA: serine/threonine-protein kinase [Coleofasciculaceae cyanobacterium]
MSRSFEPTNSEKPLGGRYKIISELGAGGFGQTFLAEDMHLPGHPRCVVKQLLPKTSNSDTLAMARRLFDREAQVLYQLGDHDQIPRLLAHFEDNEEFYLAQELIEGEPLTKELVSGQRWSEVQVIALLQDILEVLAFVHEQQVIHRDIKPPNLIRRQQDGRIVLIDFGAVKQVSLQAVNPEELTNLTISIGTKGYMPNEQLAGSPRFSSDVYAVGMLAIQALTGVNPKRLGEDPETGELNWRDRAPQARPELAAIIDQMVCYDFRDRYPTATEALEALQSLPPVFLESVPPSQPLSEATGATSSLELPTPSSTIDPTESGTDLGSTNIWVPTELPAETSPSVNVVEETAPLSQQEQPSARAALTSATSGLLQRGRGFVKLWSILAGLAAVGAIALIAKTAVSPQFANQTTNRSGAPTASPTKSPVEELTPTSTPPKPKPAELLRQADDLRKAGEHQKALSLYDQVIGSGSGKNAIALKPDVAKAYWGRCYSLEKMRKPAEAIVACNDALDLKRNYPEALWSKANALYQQKQTIEALALYERATEIKPDFPEAWLSLGVALQSVGRSVEAIDALDKAIALKRDSAQAWSTKGEALWNLGRFAEAIPALDKALQLQPDNPNAIKIRKKAKEELGR